MIIAFIISLIIALYLMERKWAAAALEKLTYDITFEPQLAEPGEIITSRSIVENHSPLPILYMGLNEYYPMTCTLEEKDEWKLKYTKSYMVDRQVHYRSWLMPWSRFIATKHISFAQRGRYELGKYCLETGDFLGFNSEIDFRKCTKKLVIIPNRCTNPLVFDALGGYLGDISVRRFIMEDPILTVGYRDYTGREPMKSISWQQSARAGKLMVKQYDHTVDANVTVLLNLTSATNQQIESALEITRTVCETLENKRIPFDFYTNGNFEGPLGQQTQIAKGLGRQHLTDILYGLGQMDYRILFSFDLLVQKCLENHMREQSYLLISTELTPYDASVLHKLQASSDYKIGKILVSASDQTNNDGKR